MTTHPRSTALDVLEREDTRLLEMFAQLDDTRGGDVEDRYRYGNLAKQLIVHVAKHEAAVVDVTRALEHSSGLGGIAEHMEREATGRRELLDHVEHMSRGVSPLSLNTGQDFDSHLTALVDFLTPEIRWELDTALPDIRRAEADSGGPAFHSARRVDHHAPTNLSPSGPKWYERAPLASRLMTISDHLRDYPRAARGHRD
jgi:hypothetical protein